MYVSYETHGGALVHSGPHHVVLIGIRTHTLQLCMYYNHSIVEIFLNGDCINCVLKLHVFNGYFLKSNTRHLCRALIFVTSNHSIRNTVLITHCMYVDMMYT